MGNGPIAAFCDALSSVDLGYGGLSVRVLDYNEHALTSGRDAEAAAYLEIEIGDEVHWGVGISESITQASLRGVISQLSDAYQTFFASNGKNSNAKEAVAVASRKLNSICPGVAS